MASIEISSSKLNLIRNYLKLSLNQPGLRDLSTISIESDILEDTLDTKQILADFTSIHPRKIQFS